MTASTDHNAMMPTRRDLKFGIDPAKVDAWNDNDPNISHFMNTLSIFFPVGERFFIHSVRHFRDQVKDDPELAKAVTAFIGQEAMHGREHEDYNDALFAKVPDAQKMERFVAVLLDGLKKTLPKSTQLSATIALEHFTALMGDALLNEPRILENADPAYRRLWNWHALEETEHKGVAFDVWDKVMGRGPRAYVERSVGLIAATVIFWAIAIPFYLRVLQAEKRLFNLKGWRNVFRYTFGEVGFFRKQIIPYMDYFRPNFHPWQHDNRHLLEALPKLIAELESVQANTATAARAH